MLLPVAWRLGLWVPLHLALAGAISVAICGAMQNFALTLTATPPPPAKVVWAQFISVNAGVAAISIGMPTSTPGLTAAGGTAFVISMALLGWTLWRAWRRSLILRHPVPVAMYAAAVLSVLLGGALGALMGARVVGGTAYLAVRHAHLTANVLGWASFAVVGTLFTLLPTVLRVRMPPKGGRFVAVALIGGLVVQLVGWAATATPLLVVGAVVSAIGALGVGTFLAGVLRTERRWHAPGAALHLLAGVAWFVVGSLEHVIAVAGGPAGFDGQREFFLTALVGGWLVQVLLGAWSFLLPMGRPGHPEVRRRWLAAFEVGIRTQVVLLNLGLLLVGAADLGWVASSAGRVGGGLALFAGGIALGKSWLFPLLARAPVETARTRATWGG